ncbi:MAG: hypothetical protein KC912_04710 [Proteobacteria bacterium]|nr:hypothetical protein [Pseudomonadota bacterium]
MDPADFTTTKSLREHLERKVTGKLSVGRGSQAGTVYFMNGSLMGAEAADDASRMLRRLNVEKGLTEQRATELLIASQDGESIYGALFEEVEGTLLERVLTDRFEDALAQWIAANEEPTFTSMAAVFIDNIQMGVDASAVIQTVLDRITDGTSIEAGQMVSAGTGMPHGKAELTARARLRTPLPVVELAASLPLEPWAARALIAQMVARRALVLAEAAPEPEPPAPAPAPMPTGDLSADLPSLSEEAETEMLEPETEQFEPMPDRAGLFGFDTPIDDELLDAFEGADADSEEIDRLHTADVEPIDIDLELEGFDDGDDEEEPAPAPAPSGHQFDARATATFDYGDVDVDDELMGAFEGGDEPPTPVEAPKAATPLPLHQVEEDEEVIQAFDDANEYRGGERGAGNFVTESHNLDKVSLGGDDDEDMEFEADEVPAQSFGAPRLSEADAQHKVEVLNEILQVIAEEYDKDQGPGAGRAAIQLLVDGSPLQFAALFKDVTANAKGAIPHFEVLRNLYSRPPTEHRRLLQQGVLNLIDRSMSIAADDLPDDGLDHVLETSAGFRQRLGL